MSQKLLVVIGATGVQGRSVINAILADSTTKAEYKIRGITRDASSSKAKALTELGVECVASSARQADSNDKASLAKAFQGAHSVFGVTNFWETADPKVEERQGHNIADAAKEAGVRHLVWSSLYNVSEESKGKLTVVEHFDVKAQIEAYIRQTGVPCSFVMMGFYMVSHPHLLPRSLSFQHPPSRTIHTTPRVEDNPNLTTPPHHQSNFTSMQMLRPDATTKTYSITFPFPASTPIPLLDTYTDAGKFVKAALAAGPTAQRVLASAAYYTPAQLLSDFAKVYPNAAKGATYNEVTADQFKGALMGSGMPESGAVDLTGNMTWIGEYGYYHGDDLEPSKRMVREGLTSWEEFIRAAPEFEGLD
ncbi:MAG: hypothetical protein M1828_003615 [Chrysothrix sp. TS-e1954]|nr:MAG: hypothetical protein M1828_003615 [Chrysothrix sp. TS-e1954]